MSNTHVYHVLADGHLTGPSGGTTRIDPVRGQSIETLTPVSPLPGVNAIIRGAVSGAMGRITGVNGSQAFVIESLPINTIFGVLPGTPFVGMETLNFDNGASSTMFPAAPAQKYPLASQWGPEMQHAELNTFTPNDRLDTPYFDPFAKVARTILLDGTTIGVGETSFVAGNKFTTSGGYAGTILAAGVEGADYRIWVMSASGTPTVGHVLTMAVTGHTATIKTVGADTQTGTWVEHHFLPNHAGTPGNIWEIAPGHKRGGISPTTKLLRRAYEHHVKAELVADRGVRVIDFSTFDDGGADSFTGGITIQVVKCTGTFPTTWQQGETVTSGVWSAKVQGFNATNKYLYVYSTNGQTLTASTVTGSNSGTVATSLGQAIGWQKGSSYWSQFTALHTKAAATPGYLYSGSAAKVEGLFLMAWEAELNLYTTGGPAWLILDVAVQQFVQFIADYRAYVGDPELPVAVLQFHEKSHAVGVNFLGIPYAFYLRLIISHLPALVSKVSIVRSDGMEQSQSTALPLTNELLYVRPLDYLEMGERAWRALKFLNTEVTVGTFEMFPIVFVGGQSQEVGGIQASTMMALDQDPNLFPSASFPTVSTIDPLVLSWNTLTKAWEPFDVAQNANHFWGMAPGTCGPEVSIMLRQKKRFATGTSRIGLIKLAVNASCVNAAIDNAYATWDPTSAGQVSVAGSMTVTALAATSMLPQRGRFTAAAGTFTGWPVNASASAVGSAMGFVGFGGNNSSQYSTTNIAQISGDGSWIELIGAYVNEGPRSFTVSKGPKPLALEVEAAIREAFISAANDLHLIPFPALLVWENGESDIARVSEYQVALKRVLQWLERILGSRIKGATAIPKVVVQLSSRTPFAPDSDADVAAMRAAQATMATELENCVVVDPSALPLQAKPGTWPINNRGDNGVHRTARGHIMAGYMIDQAAGSLSGIPAHPEGAAAVDFGVDGGSSFTDAGPTEGIDAVATLIVEDGTGVPDAQAYFDAAFVTDYNDNHDHDPAWGAADLAAQEVAIRRGTAYVTRAYRNMWPGTRTYQTQGLPFPRTGIVDPDNFSISSTTIPLAVKQACAEAALRAVAGTSLLVDEAGGQNLIAESIQIDTIAINNQFSGRKQSLPRFRVIDAILEGAGLLASGFRRGPG